MPSGTAEYGEVTGGQPPRLPLARLAPAFGQQELSGVAGCPPQEATEVKYVLLYESIEAAGVKAPAYLKAHEARIREFHSRGCLVMTGSFTNAEDGAMGIFTTREAAEEFIKEDPFVVHGAIQSWHITEWDEVLAGR
jgi:uncharacterized protein YciI